MVLSTDRFEYGQYIDYKKPVEIEIFNKFDKQIPEMSFYVVESGGEPSDYNVMLSFRTHKEFFLSPEHYHEHGILLDLIYGFRQKISQQQPGKEGKK